MSASKEDKLRAAIEAARTARSNKIASLQAELSDETAKARKKKGKASADPEPSPDNS